MYSPKITGRSLSLGIVLNALTPKCFLVMYMGAERVLFRTDGVDNRNSKISLKGGRTASLKIRSNNFAVFDAYCELPFLPLPIVRLSVPHAYITVGGSLTF